MKTLQQQLGNYGLYHRSRRNVITHFFGIPLIIFAVLCLLARIQLPFAEYVISGADIFVLASVIYYLTLSMSLGLIMAAILILMTIAAVPVASLSLNSWLIMSIGTFVFGWVLQFIGHYYEGKKPAFVDDLIGLIIGPLFVLVEALFLLGLYQELEQQISDIAGPTKP
ncbi:DUF962 domain-containing protein [Pseudoalteromonas sp. NEC-BIFX-2020_002]|uniref:DUF962 domain-containing protein n=1 Tax=Pseudoalteromonas porphyrae TaxID=187330 RepID=A0A0N1MV85_9GAMM|nr:MULTISPECIES: Mpo1-like protein [Pseudoalteromonas]KPH65014.1 hypothetical protein ADS77_04190 [Pseudoalteromonas porphyrae]NNG43830.1 DUF962 domain-containing protein [Pseudoalteromonas sp. NEC-BIFX-2020_002]